MNRHSRKGVSYEKRVVAINAIYDKYAHSGLPNREIWLRYVYPPYGISERTFYRMLKATIDPAIVADAENRLKLFE